MSTDTEIAGVNTELTDDELLTSKNFPILKNTRIFQVINGETPDKLPIWIMRQAGRYLPEFREFRKNYSFFEICQTPSLACEVTLMPIRRYELDAAIIFSDILVIPQALGMEVLMGPSGPRILDPLTIETLPRLQEEGAVERLSYVGQAITLTRHRLKGQVPLFGFTGAPWTLMGYMIEGGGSKTLSKAKRWLYADKSYAHQVLRLLTKVIIDYLVMQAEAGAQILQVFDSSAEYLNKKLYATFGLPYLKDIRDGVKNKLKELNIPDVPIVLFAKGASFSLEEQTKLGYEVLGIDWTVTSDTIKKLRSSNITLQGNLDPCALYAPKDDLVENIKSMVQDFGVNRYIVNLGHGIYPDMDTESVDTFVKTVHEIETK